MKCSACFSSVQPVLFTSGHAYSIANLASPTKEVLFMTNTATPYNVQPNASSSQPMTTLKLPLCDRTISQDISGDFSLPDYQPEIKRLLRIGVAVQPPLTYATQENLDLSGNMDYFVLYTGHDDMLYCAPLTADYHISAPLTDHADTALKGNLEAWMGDEPCCICHMSADMVTGRVTSPRRLNIKCRMNAKVKAYASCPAGTSPTISQGLAMPEFLSATIPCVNVYRGLGDMLPLQDDMILAPGDADRLRVICAEGQVMTHEVIPGQDSITCRGDVWLKLTMCPMDTQNQPSIPTVTQRKVPFSQVIDLPGVTPDCGVYTNGSCHQLSVEMDDGHLHTEMGIVIEVLAQKDIPTIYTKDIYDTRRNTSATYTSYCVENALQTHSGNFTLSHSLPLSDVNIPASARVVDAMATAEPSELRGERGKYILNGTCHVHLILQNNAEYSSTQIDLPFKYEFENTSSYQTDMWGSENGLSFGGRVTPLACRARIDGERVGMDAELCVMLHLTQKNNITALSGIHVGDEVQRSHGEYVICFPAPQDTLWSVAKKYHAPLAPLSAANGLSSLTSPDAPDSLEGVGYLIV